MTFLAPLLILISFCGHLTIWATIFNQLHATSWTRAIRRSLEKVIFLIVVVLAIPMILSLVGEASSPVSTFLAIYAPLCYIAIFAIFFRWAHRKFNFQTPSEVISVRRHLVDLRPKLRGAGYVGWEAKLMGMIPGNQSLKLSVEHRVIRLAKWPKELDGLVIAHLSDLHFTGKVCREYFEEVFRECHECNPDLIFLTGDIVDKTECLGWLQKVLTKASGRFGNFYILGNHDKRVKDESLLREAISDCGFKAVGGEWTEVIIRGRKIYLAGNELPWYRGAESLPAPLDGPSIVLSHSPDQIFWAASMNVDLLLAGHCHGGQIRLPWIGPLISPSRYGVRFADGEGTFKIDSTIMRVSRGISGDDPIRLNCPPELSILKINS